jgi:MerR family transcriptional regulator, mercuric resistance operon regulatory protein
VDDIAVNGSDVAATTGDQDWRVAWYPPPGPPPGTRHGAEAVCVPGDRIVLVSRDGGQRSGPDDPRGCGSALSPNVRRGRDLCVGPLTRYPGTGSTVAGMRTGQVAEQAGVNVQTLRYYERRGLLPEPARRESGYRVYGPDAVHTVRFIKRAQELGFGLSDAESLLGLAAGGPESCDAARDLADEKIAELDRRISDLVAMRESLGRLAATCAKPRAQRECPLLQSIQEAADAH